MNLELTHEIPPDFRAAFIYLFKSPYAIGPVPSVAGHAIAYRWRSLPRVHRHSGGELGWGGGGGGGLLYAAGTSTLRRNLYTLLAFEIKRYPKPSSLYKTFILIATARWKWRWHGLSHLDGGTGGLDQPLSELGLPAAHDTLGSQNQGALGLVG